MEHHREVAFDAIDKIEKVLLREACRHHPVETFPDDKGARGGRERPDEDFGTVRRPFEEMPTVIVAVSDDIEVPSETRDGRCFSTGHGEAAALGE